MILLLGTAILFSGCASLNKTQKGGAVGVVAGGAMGAVIGKAAGNTGLGAIIGAAVGGATGAKVERVGEGIVVEFSSNVLFGFDRSSLSADARTNLDKLVVVLNAYPDTDIEIQGHTDDKGSETYNRTLSEKRAGVVSDYLTGEGIAYSRVRIKGFGETLPKYSNTTDDGRSQNRRVEFLITANEKMKAEAEKERAN